MRGQRIEGLALYGAFQDGNIGAAERVAERPVDECIQGQGSSDRHGRRFSSEGQHILDAVPLLKQMLTFVITDEARHVHYGVLALQKFYATQVSEKERREREDWAFEVAYLLRNRFLAHEYYEEHWAHAMPRAEWNQILLESEMMALFRRTMFRRIVPNLKRIGLLSPRVRAR